MNPARQPRNFGARPVRAAVQTSRLQCSVQARAREYSRQVGARLAPFGVDMPEAIATIAAAARSIGIEPDEVWCASGSGVLARALQVHGPRCAGTSPSRPPIGAGRSRESDDTRLPAAVRARGQDQATVPERSTLRRKSLGAMRGPEGSGPRFVPECCGASTALRRLGDETSKSRPLSSDGVHRPTNVKGQEPTELTRFQRAPERS
jgi:hypothetical protein